jgi:hypothetical protein
MFFTSASTRTAQAAFLPGQAPSAAPGSAAADHEDGQGGGGAGEHGDALIARTSTTGRGIAVTPTERAEANLRTLRTEWSRELAGILGDDLDAVRDCNRLLSRLEQQLIDDHADQQTRS